MSTNITTLVLNLIISESQLHRSRIATEIRNLIEAHINNGEQLEIVLQRQFILQMKKYVEQPEKNTADALFQLATFYRDHFLSEMVQEIYASAA
ncbi:MAG TPA: hypothetical protein VGB50_00210 [Flavobacterium sp.]|jgi:siroheme synthase (precorrin-2 oxidase/ferrochelatase)